MISIIIPVYNVEPYLPRCLDSVAGQTYGDFEAILIDDGSSDRSGAICDKYAAQDSHFRVIHQPNGGVSVARQTGLEAARGEYVIHIDPDDWVEPDMLEELYTKALEENADIVVSDFFMGKRYYSQAFEPLTAKSLTRGMLFQQLHGSCWNKLMKRTCYSAHHIKFEPTDICIKEDLLFNLRLLQYNPKVTYLPRAFYHYCFYSNTGSLCHRITPRTASSQKSVVDELDKMGIFKTYPLCAYTFKKDALSATWRSGDFNSLPKLYPEIHDEVKLEGRSWNPLRPISYFLALALKGKPHIALALFRFNMQIITVKERLQRK